MTRVRVKVCCISSVAELRIAVDAGADAVGLVGAMPSGPGVLTDDQISALVPDVPPPVTPFLLTSETTAGGIAEHAARTGALTVQIVSETDPSEIARLAAVAPALRRVQVIHVDDASIVARAAEYAPYVHAFLLDSGRPNAPTPQLGGTGRTHDWSLSAELIRTSTRPVFLAGGLTPDNVADAVAAVQPFGVDLCSGVRSGDALDADKLSAFMRAVRAATG